MRTLIGILLWFILLAICWPLALLMIFIFPLLWILLLPFKILGFTLGLVFKIIEGIILFPFKILGVV